MFGEDGYLDVVIHEEYNNVTLANDIALITLGQNVRNSIKGICLVQVAKSLSMPSTSLWNINEPTHDRTPATARQQDFASFIFEGKTARVAGLNLFFIFYAIFLQFSPCTRFQEQY